jgi:formylglycine-generating enzyme required for sulfatase activity
LSNDSRNERQFLPFSENKTSMKRPFISILFLSFPLLLMAQENYTEKVPGTDAEFTMIFVAAGNFEMGLPKSHEWYEKTEGTPQTVSIDAFWMGETEVTYDQFTHFQYRQQDNNESKIKQVNYEADAVTRPTPPYEDMSFGMGTVGGFPAVSMTQQAALRYCRWLYLKTGHFYRLPTEAEWEYACRAGNDNMETDEDELEEVAWYYENAYESFHKTKEKEPNDWGFYDMLGNVTEWTLDQYVVDYHEQLEKDADNPWHQPTLKYAHTTRGGSFEEDPEDCHCAARIPSAPRWQQRDPQIPKSKWWNTDAAFVGFRVVRPVQQMTHEEILAFYEEAIVD